MRKGLMGLWVLAIVAQGQSTRQWVPIMMSFSSNSPNDTVGYFYIPTPNNYTPGELFQEYRIRSGDTLSSFVYQRDWVDAFVHHHHYEYQHYFVGIPVYAAVVREHFDSTGLYLLNGKIGLFDGIDTLDFSQIVDPDSAVIRFLRARFGYPNDTAYYFAWENPLWEEQIKEDTGDSTATWFPTARLMWVTPDLGYTPGPYLRNLKLAYAIDVFCLQPLFDTTYFVNAFRPEEVILKLTNITDGYPTGTGRAHASRVQMTQANHQVRITVDHPVYVAVYSVVGEQLIARQCAKTCLLNLNPYRGLLLIQLYDAEGLLKVFKINVQ